MKSARKTTTTTTTTASDDSAPSVSHLTAVLSYFFVPLFFPLCTVWSFHHAGGGGAWTFLSFAIAFVLVPLLDLLMGEDKSGPFSEKQVVAMNERPEFRYICYLWVPINIALVFWGCWLAGTGRLSAVEFLGLSLSIGLINGGSFTVAHELSHQKDERWLSDVILSVSAYMHFSIEHPLGHHVNVATPEDPASARYKESFYQFWPRTVKGSWLSAWKIETTRLQKLHLPVWSVHNRMLWYIVAPASIAIGVLVALGIMGLMFWAYQAFLSFTVFEIINYVEHYGLERKRMPDGRYEPVGVQHSWNSNTLVTNYILLKLPRHSDHHMNAWQKYQALRNLEGGPELPAGYSVMTLLALVPPLWFKIMNPRVEAWRAKHLA